jgi:hypothetical protein
MARQLQLRKGTASEWTTANPLLAEAEPGYETDTGLLKLGNGTDNWDDLPYFTPVSNVADKKEAITLDATDVTNQYVDLQFEAIADSINFTYNRVSMQEGVDYNSSVVAGPVTRITFDGDLATGGGFELIDGSIIYLQYRYEV